MSAVARPVGKPDSRLARAYRWLIRAYPPGPRRDELLDTLIEAAGPERGRPQAREAVSLVQYGLRARLGRPVSTGIVVLASFVALAGGFSGASGANRLGWEAVGPLPVGAEGDALAATALPGLTTWGGGDARKVVTQPDLEGVEWGYAVYWAKHTPATRDVGGYLAAARDRMTAAGWQIIGVDPPVDNTDLVGAKPGDAEGGFTAVRGGLSLHLTDVYRPGRPAYDADGSVSFVLWHRQPAWLTIVTYLAALLGTIVGWLLTGWASRRLEDSPGASAAAGVAAGAGLLCLVPAALMALPPGQGADTTGTPFWGGLAYLGREPAILAGMLALLALGIAALHRPPRALAVLRRRSSVVTAAVLVTAIVAATGTYAWADGRRGCTPAVPSGVQDPPSARLSHLARVFVSPQSTAEQRNFAEAAIGRAFGTPATFDRDPGSADFSATYCRTGRVSRARADTLPWYWNVDLPSPGLFGGVAAEVATMPGVVAVQHVAAR